MVSAIGEARPGPAHTDASSNSGPLYCRGFFHGDLTHLKLASAQPSTPPPPRSDGARTAAMMQEGGMRKKARYAGFRDYG